MMNIKFVDCVTDILTPSHLKREQLASILSQQRDFEGVSYLTLCGDSGAFYPSENYKFIGRVSDTLRRNKIAFNEVSKGDFGAGQWRCSKQELRIVNGECTIIQHWVVA